MTLDGCLLQQISHQRAHASWIGRIGDLAGLRDWGIVPDGFVWEEAAVNGAEGNRIWAITILLEEQIGICEQLCITDPDPGIAPLHRIVDPQRLPLRNGAATHQREQRTTFRYESLPAIM